MSVNMKLGWNKTGAPIFSIPWEDFFSTIPIIFLISILIAVLVVRFGDWDWRIGRMPPHVSICEKCGTTKIRDHFMECKCGGKFVDFIEMKWVDEK